MMWVLAHALGPSQYGAFVFLFSVGCAVGLVATWGQQLVVLKHYDPSNDSGRNKCVLESNFRILGTSTLGLVVLGVVLFLISDVFPQRFEGLYIAILIASAFSLSEYGLNYFRARGQIMWSLVPRENLWRFGIILCGAVCVLFGTEVSGAQIGVFAAATLWGVAILQVVRIRRQEKSLFSQSSLDCRTTSQRYESYSFTAHSLFEALSSFFETILVGAVLGFEAAAAYFIAVRLSQLLSLSAVVASTVHEHKISQSYLGGRFEDLKSTIKTCSIMFLVPALLISVPMVAFGDVIMSQFGDAFAESANVLVILTVSVLIRLFMGPGDWIMILTGGERDYLMLKFIVFPIYLILLWTLSQYSGVVGVAIASLCYVTALHSLTAYWSWSRRGVLTVFPLGTAVSFALELIRR